jgi:hypothetical protein
MTASFVHRIAMIAAIIMAAPALAAGTADNVPYGKFEEFVSDLMLHLPNPLLASELQQKVKVKGFKDFPVQAYAIEQDQDAWMVRFSVDEPTIDGMGFYCRVQQIDQESVAKLRQLTMRFQSFAITGAVSEFEFDVGGDYYRLVLDPCRIGKLQRR